MVPNWYDQGNIKLIAVSDYDFGRKQDRCIKLQLCAWLGHGWMHLGRDGRIWAAEDKERAHRISTLLIMRRENK